MINNGVNRDNDRAYNCPVCKGAGVFELPKKIKESDYEIKKFLVKYMHQKGYSIRQIMRGLNYKSPQSVSKIINNK